MDPDKLSARRSLGIASDSLCIVILPGSRLTEVEMLSADFLRAVLILNNRFSNLKILVPLVSSAHRIKFDEIKRDVSPTLSLTFLDRDLCQSAIIASDAAIAASGTVALECVLAKCPVVVGYRLNYLTFWLAKKLVKVKHISLPNLLSGSTLVQELIQDQCTPEALAEALEPLLSYSIERDILLKSFYKIHKQIRCNADKKAKDAILGMIYD
jgi:lipid-A-disaccharide synthase